MPTNLGRYKADLEALCDKGEKLHLALQRDCLPGQFEEALASRFGEKAKEVIAGLPRFNSAYERWYSASKAIVKLLLPDRLDDFVRHYESPKSRKEITYENYRIADCLLGLRVRRGHDNVVGPDAAIPHFRQQVAILSAVKARFEISLFDIRQLVAADFMDSELAAASELLKQGFLRAAGAVAGVLVEKHLLQVCTNHSVSVPKKNPGINDLAEALKSADIVDIPAWRFIQRLADLRNLCDHSKSAEPSREQVADLIEGARKLTKTLF
jgi:hypothetical protein